MFKEHAKKLIMMLEDDDDVCPYIDLPPQGSFECRTCNDFLGIGQDDVSNLGLRETRCPCFCYGLDDDISCHEAYKRSWIALEEGGHI